MTEFTLDPKANSGSDTDAKHLYNEGIQRIIELSGEIWTDYNRHDPGITIIEVLSYLLSEMSYRCQWPIPDLLTDGIEDALTETKTAVLTTHFPDATKVMPCAPLTEGDYRKLLIDVPLVRNAWLTESIIHLYVNKKDLSVTRTRRSGKHIQVFSIRGGYDVQLLLSDGLTKAEQHDVLDKSTKLLAAHRNLGHWFNEPTLIKYENFVVCADIEIAAKASPQTVAANIWFKIQSFLQQPIERKDAESVKESLDWDSTVFNGPLLQHGCIDNHDLANTSLRTSIRLSDIIAIVMAVDDVLAVRDLIINPEALSTKLKDKWLIDVKADRQPRLNVSSGQLSLFKQDIPCFYDKTQAINQYRRQVTQSRKLEYRIADYDLKPPTGQNRNIAQHKSVQWDFPALYKLGLEGSGTKASPERKAKVLQLRGFLSFFDQLAANFLAQTHHLRDLLSADKHQLQSYFGQLPNDSNDWQKIYGSEASAADKLSQLLTDEFTDLDRRNRFLDFMLARFGEDMTGLTDIMLNAFEPSPIKTLAYKADFYSDVHIMSRDRGLGHNLTLRQEIWNSDNVSGLQKRLCRLLGISNSQRRNLSDISFDIYAEIDQTPDDEFRFRVKNKFDNKILLSSSTNYVTKSAAKAEMREAILHGQERQFYSIQKTKNDRYYFNIVNDQNEIIARRIEYFKRRKDALFAINQVMDYLNVQYSDEGMYILEHWWLLPEHDNERGLAICLDDNCQTCFDPYTFQIHIILPGFGKRFSNLDFRRYCEGVIRSEVPAHLLPKVCWIGKDDMAVFEKAYKEFLAIKHGRARANAAVKRHNLLDALNHINNIYETQHLHDCDCEDTGFVVGRTALGSFKEST